MKVLGENLKENFMRIKVDVEEDLWHLKFIIEPGDLIGMKSLRTSAKGKEKIPVFLKLNVEKIEYNVKNIKVLGIIKEAPEDVSKGHHSFFIEVGTVFDLQKEWKKYHLDRIKRALISEKYRFLVCLIEKEVATFSIITEIGIENLAEVESGIQGKMFKSDRTEEEFYGDLKGLVERNREGVDKIIIAGPGFEKESFSKYLKHELPELAGKILVEGTSTTGTAGIQELLKMGSIEKILRKSRIFQEIKFVEKFLTELKKGNALNKKEAIAKALDYGAVEHLLVLNEAVKENVDFMEKAEKQGGKIHIIHEDHDSGKILKNFGGLGAILRFKVSPN